MRCDGLFEAKKCFGTFENLAKALGVKPQRLNNWLNHKNQMPIRYAVKIIEITKGKITFKALTSYLDPEDIALSKWFNGNTHTNNSGYNNPPEFISSFLTAPVKDILISERIMLGKRLKQEFNRKRGRPAKKNVHDSAQFSNLLNLESGKRTRELIAKRLGFGSHFTYQQAQKVIEKGVPALIKLMDEKAVSIYKAALIATLPKHEQQALIDQGIRAIKKMAKKIMIERCTG
jgi:DNA-binding transcriptional regulator YdaS (Cro superfamily)